MYQGPASLFLHRDLMGKAIRSSVPTAGRDYSPADAEDPAERRRKASIQRRETLGCASEADRTRSTNSRLHVNAVIGKALCDNTWADAVRWLSGRKRRFANPERRRDSGLKSSISGLLLRTGFGWRWADLDGARTPSGHSSRHSIRPNFVDKYRTVSVAKCPKHVYKYRTMRDLKQTVIDRIGDGPPGQVWTPVDFLDLGSRAAVDKVLQRLVSANQLRRIDRGLYDTPRLNSLTKRPAVADYRQIIDALGRRDQLRMLVDGMTAANDLGLTTAVPARVVVHTDTRRRAIHLDSLTIEFKQTAPSKLYWSGPLAQR